MSTVPQRRVSQTSFAGSRASASEPGPSAGETSRLPGASSVGEPISISNEPAELDHGPSNAWNPERKKCWICLAEEGEVGANGKFVNPGRWSKACACSLDAHESCLITWINQSRTSASSDVSLALCSLM
jgi:RING-variant domain